MQFIKADRVVYKSDIAGEFIIFFITYYSKIGLIVLLYIQPVLSASN